MKNSIYLFIVSLILLGNQSSFAQNDEGMIVLSEENIIVLINKLRAYKNAKKIEAQYANVRSYNVAEFDSLKLSSSETDYLRKYVIRLENEVQFDSLKLSTSETAYLHQHIARLENDLIQTKKELAQTKNTKTPVVSSINDDNKEALLNINKELEEIRYYMQELSNKPIKEHKTIEIQDKYVAQSKEPKAKTKKNIVPIVPIITTHKDNNAEYDKLQAEIDSLHTELALSKKRDTIVEPQAILKQVNYDAAFLALQNRMDTLRLEMETQNKAPTSYDLLKAKFKNYTESIFFANNSVALSLEAQITVDELYTLLDENDNLDIVVKGFASNRGNPKYNETISMQRTETIKKAFLLRGLHPTRVLTQYHGIDYNAEDDASARRVEATFLVRK